MSSDEENALLQAYKNDTRVPCQYGDKCYRKNPQHRSEYKHPPKTGTIKQQIGILIKGNKRKEPEKNDVERLQKKLQRRDESSEENLYTASSSLKNDVQSSDKDNNGNSNVETETSDKNVTAVHTSSNKCQINLIGLDVFKDTLISNVDTMQNIISKLFLVKMPTDFFKFYKFCKSISKFDPLHACISVGLELVGPYDVLCGKINSESSDNKEKYLTHWRYYYDPPEFQTIIRCNDVQGLHFGYWRDDVVEKPVFVAKNCGNVNGIFKPVAENIFGAVDTYLINKAKLADPFHKTTIISLHCKLKYFARQHNITLEKNTTDMQLREKKVVARTFHTAGIVVPYDKKTQLGYRDLAITDNDLRNLLKQIEEGNPDEKKVSIVKLDEVIRLATIAADECDFGTCLELGHDLFCNGSINVQNRALEMLSIAYTHLRRPQLLKILEIHLKNRKKNCELSVI